MRRLRREIRQPTARKSKWTTVPSYATDNRVAWRATQFYVCPPAFVSILYRSARDPE